MVERMGSLTDLGYGLGKNWEDPRWEEVLDQLTFLIWKISFCMAM